MFVGQSALIIASKAGNGPLVYNIYIIYIIYINTQIYIHI